MVELDYFYVVFKVNKEKLIKCIFISDTTILQQHIEFDFLFLM